MEKCGFSWSSARTCEDGCSGQRDDGTAVDGARVPLRAAVCGNDIGWPYSPFPRWDPGDAGDRGEKGIAEC
eukprot:2073651-Alexandrium_andersonii.AAC.1